MAKFLPVLVLLVAVNTSAQSTPAPGIGDNTKDAVAVTTKLFDAMRAKDAAAIRALFTNEGQLAATQRRDGQPNVRIFTGDSFARMIADAKGVLRERMFKTEVRVTGDLAVVWGRYGFYVDDRFSHCGTNAFHLLRTEGGWKIANAASTIEREGCEPESKEKN